MAPQARGTFPNSWMITRAELCWFNFEDSVQWEWLDQEKEWRKRKRGNDKLSSAEKTIKNPLPILPHSLHERSLTFFFVFVSNITCKKPQLFIYWISQVDSFVAMGEHSSYDLLPLFAEKASILIETPIVPNRSQTQSARSTFVTSCDQRRIALSRTLDHYE